MTSFYVPCVLMIFLYWRTFRAISARAHKMAAAARRRKSVEVMMTGSGGARSRAVEVPGDDNDREQQSPPAATVVVHAVVNGSDGVDTASTPIIGDQLDAAAKYPDYQTMRGGGGDTDQAITGSSDVDGGVGQGERSAEEGAGTTTSAVGDIDDAELTVRRPSHRQRRHRRMVVQPLHDSPSLTRRPLFRSGRQQPASTDSKQRAGKTITSGLRMRRSAIFAFGLQRIVQKTEKLSTKRERKATQTLAIVLGMSLSDSSQICFLHCRMNNIKLE